MFFINSAHAQEALGAATEAPVDPTLFNLGLIFVLFFLFYFLMIRPQNKRMKEQRSMLDSLKKGDTVLTAGGLVGKISKVSDERELEIELSKGTVVKAMRYTIQEKLDNVALPTNDNKPAKKTTTKKTAAKKTPAKKKTAGKK